MNRSRRLGKILAVAVALFSPRLAEAAGDVATGKAAFAQCSVCHSTSRGVNGVGPSLYGVVGRKIGTSPGFAYTPALAHAGETWTETRLERFLIDPAALYPGTRMNARIADPQTRADLVAYLRSLAGSGQ